MSDNEKRILTLLSQRGPLSKRELSEQGQLSWATVVKIVARLEQAGVLQHVGTDDQPETTGKNPLVYDLADRGLLAVGIDVSYAVTHIILTNLKHTVLAQATYPTPCDPTKDEFKAFLAEIFVQFVKDAGIEQDALAGVGVGMPRWLVKHEPRIFARLSEELTAQLHTRVRVENCICSYTLYQKWIGTAGALNDFVLIALRDGVGTGIFYRGNLFRGSHGLAGGLSHLTVNEDGDPCRCGKQGCLENQINQDVLYQQYVQRVLQQPVQQFPSEAEMHRGLADLFSRASRQEPEALKIVEQAAHYIGVGVAALLLILDIPHVILAADFGPDGGLIRPLIEREVARRITPDIAYSLTYAPLQWLGFAQGAPLLIFKNYFTALTQPPV